MCKVSARWYSLLLGAALIFGLPSAALAQSTLTWAKVERLRNRVHLIPNNRNARRARVADVMGVGDALRTAASSRAELSFNDGSLARVGEQATFRFTPNTRNFQLSNGTVLLLIPPGRGRTTIQTPNAVTGIQGSALFVRVRCLAELSSEGHCPSPVTLVGALTNNPAGPMVAYSGSGFQQQPIYAGEMVVIEGDVITQRHQFDLKTFYETSGLVEGLQLDSSTPPANLPLELQEVWQEIQDALELQGDFDNQGLVEEIVENPGFIAPVVHAFYDELNETAGDDFFVDFPPFASSPAAAFHGTSGQVATSQSEDPATVTVTEVPREVDTTVTSAIVREAFNNTNRGISSGGPTVGVSSPATPEVPTTVTPTQPEVPTIVSTPTQPEVPSTPTVPTTPTQPEVPTIVSTPTQPEVPSTPISKPTPEIPTTPVVTNPPEVVTPDLEPDRVPVDSEEFNWQQPSGANDPDVLQGPNFSIDGSTVN
ncbi:FecR domain-containing protein [Leptothoe sp. EHU-05/26/07-4]